MSRETRLFFRDSWIRAKSHDKQRRAVRRPCKQPCRSMHSSERNTATSPGFSSFVRRESSDWHWRFGPNFTVPAWSRANDCSLCTGVCTCGCASERTERAERARCLSRMSPESESLPTLASTRVDGRHRHQPNRGNPRKNAGGSWTRRGGVTEGRRRDAAKKEYPRKDIASCAAGDERVRDARNIRTNRSGGNQRLGEYEGGGKIFSRGKK